MNTPTRKSVSSSVIGRPAIRMDDIREAIRLELSDADPGYNRMTHCSCGRPFEAEDLDWREEPHEAGYLTDEAPFPMWLYLHCAKCTKDWALWKLKMERYLAMILAGVTP